MSQLDLGRPPAASGNNDAVSGGRSSTASRPAPHPANGAIPGRSRADERDQLARDLAEIERASAALRRAEPALETWAAPPARPLGKPHPVWLLIGALWVSTALITVGAAVAIAALVG